MSGNDEALAMGITGMTEAEAIRSLVMFDVHAERERQERKWGEQNHDPFTYLTVLMEEVGELSQCALHAKFGGPAAADIRKEAVQVAAVAVAIIECLDRGKWSFRSDVDANGNALESR